MLLQQQQQLLRLHRATKLDSAAVAATAESRDRTGPNDSVTTLSRPPSVDSSFPPTQPPTNLDRLLESVSPFVTARCISEVKVREQRTREAEFHPFYSLNDLWKSFSEWSVYGVGVPLLLNGKDPVKQYYVPFLSGKQLYIDPSKPRSRLRRPGDENDAESTRETSSGGSSDFEADKRSQACADGLWNQYNLVNLNTQPVKRQTQRENSGTSSSSDEAESCNSAGQLLFEYLEQEQPRNRKPLCDKISVLASQFPELRKLRSCDLLPASWISAAWYPIYRIPIGSTLRDMDASFFTFHCLSTHSKCSAQQAFHGAPGQKVHGFVDASSKMCLPVFGLASYKWKGSILTPGGPREYEQENSLWQAADNWLQRLHVGLADYQFFRAHYSQRR